MYFLSVHTTTETSIPADLLLLRGTCIVNEAMLSGESTPLLKESIELREGAEKLDIDGIDKGSVLFGGTKALQAGGGGITPDGGCLAVVLRTGFGTAQGQLVRTMIFSTERVSANNMESFMFIGFLLIFAIAASWYVWVTGTCLWPAMHRSSLNMLVWCVVRFGEGNEEIQAPARLYPYCNERRAARTPYGAFPRRQRLTCRSF
jgi:magnesium-transporting ATPase (P-type)